MMKYKAFLWLGLFLAEQNSYAIDNLNKQINQNVKEVQEAYERLTEQKPLRLWIHARTQEQKQLLQNVPDWIKRVAAIKIEPIEMVKNGPKKTQLRFFSIQDKEKVEVFFKKLQKVFPQIELQDMSAEYGNLSRMEAGRLELWLAPDLKKITLPD